MRAPEVTEEQVSAAMEGERVIIPGVGGSEWELRYTTRKLSLTQVTEGVTIQEPTTGEMGGV